MNDALSLELQQAIAAAHEGKMDQARILADQVIQDDPENESALYLLSALADSDEERQAYLSHILIVNPNHTGAQKYIAEFDEASIIVDEKPAVTIADLDDNMDDLDEKVVVGAAAAATAEEFQDIFQDSSSLIDEDASETIPDWLLDEEEFVDEAKTGTEGDTDLGEIEQMPDWLTDDPSDPSIADQEESELLEEPVEQEPVPVPVEPVPKPKPAAQKGPSDRVLTIILVLLAVVAVVIVGGIIFLAINRPFIS